MLSPRWLIGITLYMVVAFVLGNWIDGSPTMFTPEQSSNLTAMTGSSVVTTTASTGSQVNSVNINPLALLTIIGRALTWDYSFFHDTDPVTGADANTDLGMLLFVIRMMHVTMTVGIIFQMAYLLRSFLPG